MDSMRPNDASNPLSDVFRREALDNVAHNIASLKNNRELKDASPTDSFEKTRADKLLAGADKMLSESERAEKATQQARAQGDLDQTDPEMKRRRREEAERLAQDGVPTELLQAARHIVEGQVHPVKGPRASLKDMKSPEETAHHETSPAGFHQEMDIHDSYNRPTVIEEDSGS